MNELTKKKQVSTFAGVTIFVDHYYSNSFKKFEDGYLIEWHPQVEWDDKRMLDRLFTYACKTSYEATKDEAGGWTKPSKDGSHEPRCKGEIFFDVFTGKLGELSLYRFLLKNGYIIEEPNIDEPRGYNNSDSFDLEWNGKNISVKTTTEKGNLLLLQTKQYDKLGRYQPNLKKNICPSYFDYHVLCKYRDADSADVSQEIAFSKKDFLSEDEQERLKQILLNRVWHVGIMGFISNEELVEEVIRIGQVIPGDTEQQRTCFGKNYNKRTRVDVDNYYVQAGDMHDIRLLVKSERKEELIGKLDGSQSFKETHDIVRELLRYTSWTKLECERVVNSAFRNRQISNILKDRDVFALYNRMIDLLPSEQSNEIRDRLGIRES